MASSSVGMFDCAQSEETLDPLRIWPELFVLAALLTTVLLSCASLDCDTSSKSLNSTLAAPSSDSSYTSSKLPKHLLNLCIPEAY